MKSKISTWTNGSCRVFPVEKNVSDDGEVGEKEAHERGNNDGDEDDEANGELRGSARVATSTMTLQLTRARASGRAGALSKKSSLWTP